VIHERLLGLRRGRSTLTIDPALPRALDGLAVDLEVDERPLRIVYAIANRGCGPMALELNGTALPFEREPNPYRTGGAIVPMAVLREHLGTSGNELKVRLE
jgi:cellobiose phosphorylase